MKLDSGKKKDASSGNAARNKFMQMDSRAQTATPEPEEVSNTHINTINTVRSYTEGRSGTTHISTTGIDGQLVIWDLLNAKIAGISLN